MVAESSWLAMQGGGAALGAIGAFASAYGSKQMLGIQAEIDNINASTSERAAQAAMLAGQHEEQRVMLNTAQLKGAQEAGFAAHGIDLGEGSAARTLASTDIMGKIDANTVASNAVRSAWGYRTQATSYRNAALMKSSQASAISPLLSTGTSLLTSAAGVSEKWYMLNKAGAFSQPANDAPGTFGG